MLNRTIRRRNGVDEDALAGDLHPLLRRLYAARGIRLASELDLSVIAEGVETIEEIERLQQLNCQFAQGFAFGAAMTGQEFGKRLQSQLSGR